MTIVRPIFVACLALGLLVPAYGQAPPGLLFHASFDVDRRADFAAGDPLPTRGRYANENYTAAGGTIGPGVFANAITGAPRLGAYDAVGNIDPRRGTVCFFIKFTNKPYGFEPFVVRSVDSYYWLRYLRTEIKPQGGGEGFALVSSVADELYRPRGISDRAAPLKPDTWHHIAIVWDHAQGLRSYIDGKLYASSWGRHTWLSHGVDVDFLWLQLDPDVSYDELWVFDRALSDEQVLALQQRNQPPAALDPVPFDAAHRLAELSWQSLDSLPRLTPGLPFALRQVIPLQARAVMNECNIAIDGKLGGGFPATYGYRYADGNGLHVQTAEPFDYVTIEGRFQGDVYSPRTLLPEGQTPIASIRSPSFLQRWRLDHAQPAGWLSFFRTSVEDASNVPDKEQVVTGRINELGFFQLGQQQLAGVQRVRYDFGPLRQSDDAVLSTAFGEGDRGLLTASSQPLPPGRQPLQGLRYHHLYLPAAAEDRVLSGLRLVLCYRSEPSVGQQALRLEVRDPALPMRRLSAIDFAIDRAADATKPLTVDLTLDLADRIVPAGKPLWLVLCLRQDAELLWLDGQRSCYVEWLAGDRDQAVGQHVAADLPLVLARFAELASPRPWSGFQVPEVELPRHYRLAGELFEPLSMIRRLQPQQSTAQAIWTWTHKETVDTSAIEPRPLAGHEQAPRWALLQRELRNGCRAVFDWWIDHRQAPSGEFGDDLNDDTDFVQDYPKFVLLNERDRRLRDSAAAVADTCINTGTNTTGITTLPTDPLHAYENGTNVLAMMALLEDGDPFHRARALEAAGAIERLLMARDVHGRLRFKSRYFGYKEVRTQGDYGLDSFTTGLMLHPALTLAYLSGHRRASQVVADYADGWLAYWDDAARAGEKRLPAGTALDGSVRQYDTRVRGFGFASVFLGAWRISGESRHRQGLLRWCENRLPAGDAMAALEALDPAQHAARLVAWADQADLSRIAVDRFGHVARQRYVKFEVAGDERAAIDALEASLRNIRTLFDAYTLGEPQNDRIYPPDQVATVMALGDIPHERNQLWPRHYVSYAGFSDHVAWVRGKSDTQLTIWLYSFAAAAEHGEVRFWRTPPGRYRLTLDDESRRIDLHRGVGVDITLTPGRVQVLELVLEQASGEDIAQRADAAVSSRQVQRLDDGALEIVVSNLGGSAIDELVVELRDAAGAALATQTIAHLPPTVDWTRSTATVRFPDTPAAAVIVLDPQRRVPEQSERNNQVSVPQP